MKKRMLLAGSSLIVVLAACGETPQVKAATPATAQQKQVMTASVDKVTSKLKTLSFIKPVSSLNAAQATGSFTYNCDQGSLMYSFISDNGTGASSSSINLKSATCTLGDTTFSNMDLTLVIDGTYSATDLSFKMGYNGGLTVKDAKETLKIGFENVMYDLKISKVNDTTYSYVYTINGTVTANDNFVKYENETRSETVNLKI
jgi:hypothetical protein